MTEGPKDWIAQTRAKLTLLEVAFDDLEILRNRAITVSTVLSAWKLMVTTADEAEKLARFIEEFLCRLAWQIGKGLNVDREYRYLIDFQRHVIQASVEKAAVKARADTLEREYALWIESDALGGDVAYKERTGGGPSEACREEE